MDVISSAIIAAIAVGAGAGATKVAEQAIVDGYQALKNLLIQKFGKESKLVQAVNNLEEEPEYELNEKNLLGRVEQTKALEDQEIVNIAQELQDLLERKHPDVTAQVNQVVTGDNNATANNNSTATVQVNLPPDKYK